MRYASPLRYPGGKAAMANVLRQIRRLNGLGAHAIAEPFAGGAGAALTLLYVEDTPAIHINDADPAIHNFWWAATRRAPTFVRKLLETPVTIDEWHRQRDVYQSTQRTSRLDRGFAAFYLNRCNRSGIILGGSAIGGLDQTGPWKLGARFNKPALQARIERLAEYGSRITLSGLDGIELFDHLDRAATFFFVDPPYFHKGETLYLNAADPAYHAGLALRLKALPDAAWVVTYDDCPEVRALYGGWANLRPFSLRYSAGERRKGAELLITPRWMRLPTSQASGAITW